jgi:hypothetical protein
MFLCRWCIRRFELQGAQSPKRQRLARVTTYCTQYRCWQSRPGRIVINNMTDDPQAPWDGFKHSGIGREYGLYGIEAFLEPRAILE